MKYTLEKAFRVTLREFADENRLELVVTERGEWTPIACIPPYYARFRGAEVKRDGLLLGLIGNGNTPEDAIADYAKKLARERGAMLVIDAMDTEKRREIRIPWIQGVDG